jgi:hypothetical protein
MDINAIRAKHAAVGELMQQAGSAWAHKKVELATQAAQQSHELVGELIQAVAELQRDKQNLPFVTSKGVNHGR